MKITVRRIHIDRDGYALRSGPLAGTYWGVGPRFGPPLYYCPDLDVYVTSIASQCVTRAPDVATARAVFKARLQAGMGWLR